MITFRYIKYKNILSVGNNPIEIRLDSSQTHLIRGKNGAGKSTLLEALTFALYGKPYRDINKPQLVNTINNANLLVEVEFETGGKTYKVVRGIKPNIFEIYENKKLINQKAGAYDYQEYLEENILRMNYTAYSRIVVIGKATYVAFMNLKSIPRREFIEDVLDLHVFTAMKTIHKDYVDDLKSEYNDYDKRFDVINEKIDFIKTSLNKVITNTNEVLKNKNELLETNKRQYTESQTRIKEITVELESLRDILSTESDILVKKADKYNRIKSTINHKRSTASREADFFNNTTECPTCSQDIHADHRAHMLKDRQHLLEECNVMSDRLQLSIDQLELDRDALSIKRKQLRQYEDDISSLNVGLKHLKQTIIHLNEDIKQLKHQHDETVIDTSQILDLQKEQKEIKSKKYEIKKKLELYKIASHLLKDNGIKSELIKDYIPVINKKIAEYLAILDFYVQFELDESFNETIKSRHRDIFSYNSFSEGEKFRIDLAFLMTWRAIAKMRNTNSTNLIILDEIFDGSLDQDGIDAFMLIINTLVDENQTVFVISHKENLVDNFDVVLKFEKNKNFTQLLEQ